MTASRFSRPSSPTRRRDNRLYDADGNLIDDGDSEYDWNARGELTGITGATTASFAYDPFGRRISKTLGGTTTEMLYDGPSVVQESVGESLTASLINGLGIDQVFSRTTAAGTDSYLTDRLGSTIALADAEAEIDMTYTYEPFGKASSSGIPSTNPFQFTGRENDGTGLQYNRARYYDLSNGRFISPDPLGYSGSRENLYGYGNGDPLRFTDPNGMYPYDPRPLEEELKNRIADVGGVIYDFFSGTEEVLEDNADIIIPAGVCLVSSGYGCLVVSAGSLMFQTRENIENSDCIQQFFELEATTVGSTLATSAPGWLTGAGLRAASRSGASLTAEGRALLNAPTLIGPISSDLIIEPGLQSEVGSC